jgi:hypothetical protein
MKYFVIVIAVFFLLINQGPARIIHVPGQYSTIQEGIDAGFDGDTVLVDSGSYVENINFNGHSILLCSMFLPTGDSLYILSTIIDGDSTSSVVTFENGEDSTTTIAGFTIRNGFGPGETGGGITCLNNSNPLITNNIITKNHGINDGGGIYCKDSRPAITGNSIIDNIVTGYFGGQGAGIRCYESNATISNNIIARNEARRGEYGGDGGGIATYQSYPLINNNVIYNNSAGSQGGGILCGSSTLYLHNNVIYGNYAVLYGGGICTAPGHLFMANNILFANSALEGNEIAGSARYMYIEYCDIQDTVWPGVGNISVDPLFRDPLNGNFHLMATYCGDSLDSPCIDMGDPTILDSLLDCLWGLGTTRSDMGAYSGGDSTMVGIGWEGGFIPRRYSIICNYPNPFNTATTIEYEIAFGSEVELSIYDVLGRKVTTLIDGRIEAGRHSVKWDASNQSSGIYFARLTARQEPGLSTGEKKYTERMTLLK